MAVQLPPGLAQMLVKVLGQPAGAKGEAKGLVGQPGLPGQAHAGPHGPEALHKGAPIGEGIVLAGLGYNPLDKSAHHKNVHEKDSVARFLKEPDTDKIGRAAKGEGKEDDFRARGDEKMADAKELRDGQRAEARREERADEGKQMLAREAQKEERQQERERERQKNEDGRQQQQQQQDDTPQYAYVEVEPEPQDESGGDGTHDADVLGEVTQCKGHGDDGDRCLRKPMEGSSYCREHVVTTGVPRTVSV